MVFEVEFSEANSIFSADFGEISQIAVDPYTGAYQVTPHPVNDVILATKNKSMTDDVTVYKIPYEAVSNPQGGNTVTIGGY